LQGFSVPIVFAVEYLSRQKWCLDQMHKGINETYLLSYIVTGRVLSVWTKSLPVSV